MCKIALVFTFLPMFAYGQTMDSCQFRHNYMNIKETECVPVPLPVVPAMPDPKLTPGKWNVPATPLSVLCDHKHHPTSERRDVTPSKKKEIFSRYGISFAALDKDTKKAFRKTIEIDHLVSIELDGTNEVENLWPQSYVFGHNAHQKDALENRLAAMVCANPPEISLAQAQHEISTDWWASYQKYVGD